MSFLMLANVFVHDFVVFGTKIAKRVECAGNPLGFPDRHLNTMNYKRCCTQ